MNRLSQDIGGFQHIVAADVEVRAGAQAISARGSDFHPSFQQRGGELRGVAEFRIDLEEHEVGFDVLDRDRQAVDLGDLDRKSVV